MLALPLIGVLGTPVLWGLIPFAGLALWGCGMPSTQRARTQTLREELRLTRDTIEITRTNPRQPDTALASQPLLGTAVACRKKAGRSKTT